ncbi:hypothetical protein PG911_05975 [Tenacibaculum ovolyticum]|uniref:hypothetical protein n=1 Tax=Tenacibaculum ovolyticum TaxID=104270 RepID=UPI0022F40239|nr:hypothetical protein [Tenacibaculum ovolyticum]WBX77806.1 hypothetical protein PG911_05975 [Tenacibaculum ovolyticum]
MAKSQLHFLGHVVDLLTVETVYTKDFNKYKGVPIFYNKGGLLKFVFNFEANFRFLERMTTVNYDLYKLGYPIDDGKIVFYDANGDNLKDWYFKDASIIYYKVILNVNGGGMRVKMIISPAIQNYGCKIHRSWHITPIEEESYKSPVQATEKKENFYLSIQHLTDKKTLVPLGIPAFNKSPENQNIEFEIDITENGINDFQVEFLHDNKIIQSYYSGEQTLDEVVVTAKGSKNSSNSTTINQNTQNNYPKGKYHVKWDGFDKNGIYDSTIFTTGKLKARIKGKRNGKEKTAESSEFSFEYKEVTWVDTKINKNTKRIDVTLRVNLKDGGARGIECINEIIAPDPIIISECPWDEIPKEDLITGKSPLKTRIKSFKELEKLALEGLNYHWGRNKNHFIAKNVDVNGEFYEVFMNAVNTTENSMDDVNLIFNTNNSWMRSGNPGTVEDPISYFGNIISREAICYNVGYIKYSDGWGYREEESIASGFGENLDFMDTSAHEIGHTILKAYGGTFYSYGHKGSVNTVFQNRKSSAPKFPLEGEIDIMPYHAENKLGKWYRQPNYYKRRIAHKKDVLSLIWLTKLNLK